MTSIYHQGVPAEGYGGVPAVHGRPQQGGIPADIQGSAPSVWCSAVTKSGAPCKGKHLPDRDVCMAHAKEK